MREIDKNDSESRLTGALRSLADASAGGAPPEISEALMGAFRRHHARRRALRRTALAAAICTVLLPAAFWLAKRHPANPPVARTQQPAATSAPVPTSTVAIAGAARPQSRTKKVRPTVAVKRSTNVPANDFVVLSSYDQPVRGEELRIIRLEVTGNALRMVGAPVMEQSENRSVLADFVVGQDGTPYAVRLVH